MENSPGSSNETFAAHTGSIEAHPFVVAQQVHNVSAGNLVAELQILSANHFYKSWLLLIIEFSFLIAWSVLTGSAYHPTEIHEELYLSQMAASGMLVAITYCGSTRIYQFETKSVANRKVASLAQAVVCWCGSFLALSFFAFAFQLGHIFSRGAVLVFFLSGLPALYTVRRIATHAFAKRLYKNSLRWSDAVIIGSEASAIAVVANNIGARGGMAPPIVKIEPVKSAALWAGEIERAIHLTATLSHKVNTGPIYLCAEGIPPRELSTLVDGLRVIPRPVRLVPAEETARLLSLRQRSEFGTRTLEVQGAPLTKFEEILKRGMDIIVSTALVFLLLPLFVVISIAVKIDSPGPIIFRQRRAGRRGQVFKIYKFRTMHVLEDGADIPQAKANDPRVTRVGRFLRKSSLDELLQLVNVIRGEMSLVGPRPHALAHDQYFENMIPNYSIRQHMRPGMTGWAQVNGFRGETPSTDTMRQRIECDLWYTKNVSLTLDAEILLRTVALLMGQSSDNAALRVRIELFNGKVIDLLAALAELHQETRILVTPNLDHYRLLARSFAFRRAYAKADFIINDSRFLDGAFLRGSALCAPGADFVPILLGTQKPGTKVCVIGYTAQVRDVLRERFHDLDFTFLQPSMGYIKRRSERRILVDNVDDFSPDLTLICTGAPHSEIFAAQIKRCSKHKMTIVCCGSALQFLTGAKRRAPIIFRHAHIEWLWRLILEPHTRARYASDALFLILSFPSFAKFRLGARAKFKKFSLLKK